MNILVVGAGFVGAASAERWRADGHAVCCWTLTVASAAALRARGFFTVSGDCADAAAWENFLFAPDAVLFCPSTRGGDAAEYQRTYLLGLQTLLRHVSPSARVLFASSTSVYGQTDGAWVDETSPSAPAAETAKILLAAERLTVSAGGTVLRLSALYGSGRLVLRDRLLAGTARLPADGDRFLNQIHRDDAVGATDFLLGRTDVAGEVFNVSDHEPANYREIYQWLADYYHRPLKFAADSEFPPKRGCTNKRVSNQKLCALGWQPRYPSFREGYADVLARA